ncbi:MAG TPA: glycosyltransferase family 2 protein [Ilumatobacteraceae bacterium]|nr:glycosyltransferase family 2 protein [Ilumatobacteraceae bacterium]
MSAETVIGSGAGVLVVVPAYNEEDCIADVVRAVIAAGHRCLVVSDASTDRTVARANDAGATTIALPINLGVGGALRCGWRYAHDRGEQVVVQVDGDGQHPIDSIGELIAVAERDGLDMVIGSRFAHGGSHEGVSWFRRRCMNLLSRILRRSAGVTLSDPTSGFRAITQPLLGEFAESFPHHFLGDTFEAELVAGRRGYRIGEIAIAMRARQGGTPSADIYASGRAMLRALVVLVTGTSFDVRSRQSMPRR